MWKDDVLIQNSEYRFTGGIWTKGLIEDDNLAMYEKEGGSIFRERARVPGTHTYFDTQAIAQHLSKIFVDHKADVVMDLGCGDGRIVEWFLENTSCNVIAVDGTYESLKRMYETYLKHDEQLLERTLLIHADMMEVPVNNACCEFLWTYEVLCFLHDDYAKGIQKCADLLKPGGIAAIGDRSKEFGVVHELLNRGPAGMLKTFQEDAVIDSWNESEIVTRVLTADEIAGYMNDCGLEEIHRTGVSFLPLIISYLRSHGQFVSEIEDMAERLSEITMRYSKADSLNRTNIIVGRKGV